jgi:hypothetical protein
VDFNWYLKAFVLKVSRHKLLLLPGVPGSVSSSQLGCQLSRALQSVAVA